MSKALNIQSIYDDVIVRLYATHPGVTVDGIMTKMGLLGKL